MSSDSRATRNADCSCGVFVALFVVAVVLIIAVLARMRGTSPARCAPQACATHRAAEDGFVANSSATSAPSSDDEFSIAFALNSRTVTPTRTPTNTDKNNATLGLSYNDLARLINE